MARDVSALILGNDTPRIRPVDGSLQAGLAPASLVSSPAVGAASGLAPASADPPVCTMSPAIARRTLRGP
jgi:hypothetical protein